VAAESARRVICAARARVRLSCVRAGAVSACKLPSAFLTHFPCSFCPPQAFPDATGAGEGGCFRLRLPSAPLKRKSAEDPEYELSQATSLSEDSWSDVLVRHRMLSSILL
jgi:hypothetical protein